MDALDRQLVAALIRNPRADLTEVAADTDMVATTAQKRLRALEADGTIGGFAARIDYERLGYVTAIVRIAADMDAVDDVVGRLREREAFVTVYEVSGRFNVFAVGKFVDEAALDATVRELLCDSDVRSVDLEPVASVVREGDAPALDER